MPIHAEGLGHRYRLPGGTEVRALEDVDFHVEDGEVLAVVGATGSGKSTLVQHLNGLLLPDAGFIEVDGLRLQAGARPSRELLRGIRRVVGVVFQYPEQQLFGETVLEDVRFGPEAHGHSRAEAEKRARRALARVGLPEALAGRSPFQLSGGEMRRAALAGVLALEPRFLVLDEPTAGLDPAGRREFLSLLTRLNREQGTTIILVTHQMEEVAALAGRVLVLHRGRVAACETPARLFQRGEELAAWGLRAPDVVRLLLALNRRGWPVAADTSDPGTAARRILAAAPGLGTRV